MDLRYAGRTHVGMRRSHNEDALKLLPDERLFVVADGMGGHASGEVASHLAVESIATFFSDTARDADTTWPFKPEQEHDFQENRLIAAIKLANLRIFEQAAIDGRYRGMGTTIVGIYFVGDHCLVAHVGDSRAYRVRDGNIEQLTEDHSLLNDYKKLTTLTEEEEKNFPHKNIIVRALGMKETVKVDVLRESPKAGDIFLLCSDGLSGEIDDDKVLELVTKADENLDDAAESLVKAACDAGGKDNVTVVLVHVATDETEASAEEEEPTDAGEEDEDTEDTEDVDGEDEQDADQ